MSIYLGDVNQSFWMVKVDVYIRLREIVAYWAEEKNNLPLNIRFTVCSLYHMQIDGTSYNIIIFNLHVINIRLP